MKWYVFLIINILLCCSFSLKAQQLSKQELDRQKLFTSLEEALREPDNVYRLALKRLKRNDSLPEKIFLLTKLQELTVTKSKLQTINKNIVQLTNLQYLNLDHNHLVKLPDELTELIHLKKLIISRNMIYKLPETIGNMTVLYEIVAWGNELYSLPESITALSETLQKLDLRQISFRRNEIEKIESQLPKTKILYTNLCDCHSQRNL
jgi:Leucine-rich repeat (LRR) protein